MPTSPIQRSAAASDLAWEDVESPLERDEGVFAHEMARTHAEHVEEEAAVGKERGLTDHVDAAHGGVKSRADGREALERNPLERKDLLVFDPLVGVPFPREFLEPGTGSRFGHHDASNASRPHCAGKGK